MTLHTQRSTVRTKIRSSAREHQLAEDSPPVASLTPSELNPRLEFFRIAVDLVRALAWPAVLVGVLVAFRAPLAALANLLPAKLESAATVELGGIRVAASERIRSAANPELAMKLSGLSNYSIHHIMKSGEMPMLIGMLYRDSKKKTSSGLPRLIFCIYGRDYDAEVQLFAAGLIEYTNGMGPRETREWLEAHFTRSRDCPDEGRLAYEANRDLTLEEMKGLDPYSYKLTPAGQKVYRAIFTTVLDQLAPIPLEKTAASAPAK